MIKKYLWITILMFGFISCEEAPNNFSAQANDFLNAIDGKDYIGAKDTEWANSTFEVNGTIIAEHSNDGNPTQALKFRNTRNNGTSTTEAIYQYIRDSRKYVGIVLLNGGGQLGRTLKADTEAAINWGTARTFATKK